MNAVESNGEGIGLVQWSFERKTDFLDYCSGKDWKDLSIQLEYLIWECEEGRIIHR